MVKISVKIKNNQDKIPDDLKVDLRQRPSAKKRSCFLSGKANLLLFVFLLIVIAVLSVKIYYFSPKQIIFYELASDETSFFGLADQGQLNNFNQSVSRIAGDNNLTDLLKNFYNYLNRANLGLKSDILPLFESKIGLLTEKGDSVERVLLVLKKKSDWLLINQALGLIETEFRADYDFSSSSYRNIDIKKLTSLSNDSSLYYCQIDDYFLISFSDVFLKKIIDKVVNKNKFLF